MPIFGRIEKPRQTVSSGATTASRVSRFFGEISENVHPFKERVWSILYTHPPQVMADIWTESRMNFVLDKAGKKLIAMGLLPPHTLSYEVVCELNKATILRVETYLTDEEYKTFLDVKVENWKKGNVSQNT